MNKNKIFNKIVNTIFSCKTFNHVETTNKWISTLWNNRILTIEETVTFYTLLSKHIKNAAKLGEMELELDKKQMEILDLKIELERKNAISNRKVVDLVGAKILDFFNKKYGSKKNYVPAASVYDLSFLNINLIECFVYPNKITTKVYLQKPGYLIGQGGRTIDELAATLKEELGTEFEILIVETRGRRLDSDNNF